LRQLETAATLTGATPLRRRANLRLRVESGDAELRLVLLDRTVRLPANAAEAVKAVLAADVLVPDDLPGLDGPDQLDLARQLLRAGVLVPAS
jgi:hypothetical protein